MSAHNKTPRGNPSGKFRFKKHANIGAPAAEDDGHFLKTCFVDTGDLSVIRDTDNHKAIIVGRVGSGKSALLHKLKSFEEHVIELSLFNVSLEHISNSPILKFFLEAGVHLDLFYKAMWRHVFTVELIKERHQIHNEQDQKSVFSKLWNMMPPHSRKKKQIEYLKSNAGPFWKDTDERIKEATHKTENELKASIGGLLKGLKIDVGSTKTMTDEQILEIRHRGQEVINQVKIRDLNEMFDLLKSEVFDDSKKKYFVVVDRLDDDWADETLRYQLIRALIETIRDFRNISQVKIIICIRSDLLERVYRRHGSRTPTQEEKIRGLFLDLKWTRSQLIELLNKRINQLAEDCYTTAQITYEDLLPESKKRGQAAIDYILDRTFNRPRDIISFFNLCIEQAIGNPKISREGLMRAEEEYSRGRLKSVADEWADDYPDLFEFTGLLKRRKYQFKLGTINDSEIANFCLDFLSKNDNAIGPLANLAKQYMNDQMDAYTFRHLLAHIFYHVGILGLKTEAYSSVQWCLDHGHQIVSSDVTDDCSCAVHKMFWSALGINPKD
jgi:hypothetical protein